jgi:hypothetical protein
MGSRTTDRVALCGQDWTPTARWFLAQLIFDPEDGGDTFLRNVGSHTNHTMLYVRRWLHS